jgi:hypothetical protein
MTADFCRYRKKTRKKRFPVLQICVSKMARHKRQSIAQIVLLHATNLIFQVSLPLQPIWFNMALNAQTWFPISPKLSEVCSRDRIIWPGHCVVRLAAEDRWSLNFGVLFCLECLAFFWRKRSTTTVDSFICLSIRSIRKRETTKCYSGKPLHAISGFAIQL